MQHFTFSSPHLIADSLRASPLCICARFVPRPVPRIHFNFVTSRNPFQATAKCTHMRPPSASPFASPVATRGGKREPSSPGRHTSWPLPASSPTGVTRKSSAGTPPRSDIYSESARGQSVHTLAGLASDLPPPFVGKGRVPAADVARTPHPLPQGRGTRTSGPRTPSRRGGARGSAGAGERATSCRRVRATVCGGIGAPHCLLPHTTQSGEKWPLAAPGLCAHFGPSPFERPSGSSNSHPLPRLLGVQGGPKHRACRPGQQARGD